MKVSIIVPIYGVEKYIAKCADSLFNQTYKDIEYIFVNDCTKDNSMDILREIVKKQPKEIKDNIIIINKPHNEGLPQARKTGILSCTGDYVYHCDSDDWIEYNCIEILVNRIKATNADIVYFNYYKEFIDKREKSNEEEFSSPQDYFSKIISFDINSGGYCWNKIVKRVLYTEDIEFPVYNMHEDVALTSQLILNAKSISFEPACLYHYVRYNVNSICKTSNKHIHNIRKQTCMNRYIICKLLYNKGLTKKYSIQYSSLLIPLASFFAFHGLEYKMHISNIKNMLKDEHIKKHQEVPIIKQILSRLILKIIPATINFL